MLGGEFIKIALELFGDLDDDWRFPKKPASLSCHALHLIGVVRTLSRVIFRTPRLSGTGQTEPFVFAVWFFRLPTLSAQSVGAELLLARAINEGFAFAMIGMHG